MDSPHYFQVIIYLYSSVCYQSLGLESGAIRNYEINASSAEPPNMPYDARFRNPNGQGWCAQVSPKYVYVTLYRPHALWHCGQMFTEQQVLFISSSKRFDLFLLLQCNEFL